MKRYNYHSVNPIVFRNPRKKYLTNKCAIIINLAYFVSRKIIFRILFFKYLELISALSGSDYANWINPRSLTRLA